MAEIQEKSKTAEFIRRLEQLDTGERARLKRNAGHTLNEARDVTGLFYRLLPYGIHTAQEETYFLVATLFPLAEGGTKGDLGDALRQARTDKNAKGLDRRVESLLDADPTQLAFRLRQAVHFVQSCRKKVNWAQLLEDLLAWDHPDRYVQQRWARSYYAEPVEKSTQSIN